MVGAEEKVKIERSDENNRSSMTSSCAVETLEDNGPDHDYSSDSDDADGAEEIVSAQCKLGLIKVAMALKND